MHTKDILAGELEKAELSDMAAKAREGYYHDYLSPIGAPCIQLAADLAAAGTPAALAIRARHLNGEFDATTEERQEAAMAGKPSGVSVLGGKGRVNRALRPDAQAFDEIRIVTVPRYKTSGLSGDEWRISARIEFWRKGRKCAEDGWRDIATAARFLDWSMTKVCEEGKAFFGGEDDFCDQEGCAKDATVTYRLKSRYCREGHKTEPRGVEIRKFCDDHKRRGDCGLDDADVNYEPI